MSIKSFFSSQLKSKLPRRTKSSGRLVVAYWDREWLHYLVVSYKPSLMKLVRSEAIAHADFESPLAALADRLRGEGVVVQRLVVLLSRSDVEVLTMDLPAAADSEMPMLVASSIEQQVGDSDAPPIVDFYRVHRPGTLQPTSDLQSILAYLLSRTRMESLKSEAQQAGFRLAGVSVRQLPALSLLKTRVDNHDLALVVAVQLYAGEAELALCFKNHPLLMRSVRVNLEDCQRVAEQLAPEVERCMSLLPPSVEELERQWLLDTSHDSAFALAEALRKTVGTDVRTVRVDLSSGQARWVDEPSPFDNRIAAGIASDSVGHSLISSALAGAAWSTIHKNLDIDFVSPKQAPAPPNPWVRPAMWGLGGAAAAALVGWSLLSDVSRLQLEVEDLQLQLNDSKKLEARMLEKSDQVQVVENWLRDQVDWLSALSDVSQRLPDGKNATVRRLSASVNDGLANFDLSVQVVQPEDISVLESQLRSVKYTVTSKRISQSPEASEYPWKFETRITFPVEPAAWNEYSPQASSAADSLPAEDKPVDSQPAQEATP